MVIDHFADFCETRGMTYLSDGYLDDIGAWLLVVVGIYVRFSSSRRDSSQYIIGKPVSTLCADVPAVHLQTHSLSVLHHRMAAHHAGHHCGAF